METKKHNYASKWVRTKIIYYVYDWQYNFGQAIKKYKCKSGAALVLLFWYDYTFY